MSIRTCTRVCVCECVRVCVCTVRCGHPWLYDRVHLVSGNKWWSLSCSLCGGGDQANVSREKQFPKELKAQRERFSSV